MSKQKNSATNIMRTLFCWNAFCSTFFIALILSGCAKDMPPKLYVTPQNALIGEPVRIQVSGLRAQQESAITLTGLDQFGNPWSSKASFRADAAGTLDTSRDAPLEGSYQGVDQAGLFWSMRCEPKSEMVSPFVVMTTLTVTLTIESQQIASQTIEHTAVVDLDRQELAEPIVGVFFWPREITQPTPAVIVLGGSEGGYNEGWAKVLASKTRLPTLALGYFGAKGLPPTLENIPLETLERAFQWLNRQPLVTPNRFALVGASRGGELAILAASLFPQVRAVVGYTPSGIIWEGVGQQHVSAWTYRGKPFPYLRVITNEELEKSFNEAQKTGSPYSNAPAFLYSLQAQASHIPEAMIPAENSKAAFLLIGNPGDGVWPSDILSKMVIDRLQAAQHPRAYKLLSYNDGGHMLIPYPYYPTTMRKFYLPTIRIWEGLGGTAQAAARAAEDSWSQVVNFLRHQLQDD